MTMRRPPSHRDLVAIGQKADEEGRALKYDPAFCDRIIEMAQDGQFPEVWCATIGIHRATFYAWGNKYPEFDEAIMRGWTILESYWGLYLQQNMTNTALRTAALIRLLQSRFPATYGRHPSNTFQHYLDRNIPKDAAIKPSDEKGELPVGDREKMLARIRELEGRMSDRAGKT